jgi:hypothetical protein
LYRRFCFWICNLCSRLTTSVALSKFRKDKAHNITEYLVISSIFILCLSLRNVLHIWHDYFALCCRTIKSKYQNQLIKINSISFFQLAIYAQFFFCKKFGTLQICQTIRAFYITSIMLQTLYLYSYVYIERWKQG